MSAPTIVTRALTPVGKFFLLALEIARMTVKGPFQWREYIEQTWFVTKVSALPTALFTIPFGATIALLLAELTRAGVADEVATAIRREGARRARLAREIIGPALRAADTGYHAFLPLPRAVADAVVLAAAARGVELTEPVSMMADPNGPRSGIRLCLGAPSYDDLARGLGVVADIVGRLATVRPQRR